MEGSCWVGLAWLVTSVAAVRSREAIEARMEDGRDSTEFLVLLEEAKSGSVGNKKRGASREEEDGRGKWDGRVEGFLMARLSRSHKGPRALLALGAAWIASHYGP